LCHHLDYELYRLPETFHTEGFYKRESSLYYQITGAAADSGVLGRPGKGSEKALRERQPRD